MGKSLAPRLRPHRGTKSVSVAGKRIRHSFVDKIGTPLLDENKPIELTAEPHYQGAPLKKQYRTVREPEGMSQETAVKACSLSVHQNSPGI
jgi:hypothetical protein